MGVSIRLPARSPDTIQALLALLLFIEHEAVTHRS